MEDTNHVIFIHVPNVNSRSISPMSTCDTIRDKNLGFFHALSRRFCRRSQEDLHLNVEEDSRSSSTDSCSSTSAGRTSNNNNINNNNNNNSNINNSNSLNINSNRKNSGDKKLKLEISSTSSETSSSDTSTTSTRKSNKDTDRNSKRRSSSSIKRALKSLTISSRSLSCSNSPTKIGPSAEQKSNKKQPQRILRQPVTYTYLKGISGLPTQRVPRSSLCCHYGQR